jgi:hypothetical protein
VKFPLIAFNMPELDEISYSREDCIAAVRDYYGFLVKMYLKDSAIIEPPKDGWPSITPDSLRGLGKTDEVISLLRHLPYITTPYEQGLAKPNGSPFCYWADWKSYAEGVTEGRLTTATLKICSEGPDFGDDIPSHVIGLTYGGRQNPVFLLDTELGIIYWIECPDEIKNDPLRELVEDNPEDFAPENEVEWRSESPAWAIADFFELLKDHFRELNFLPISSKTVIDVWVPSRPSGLLRLVQDIYREHGWPDLGKYRKQECLEAVQTALEEQYPDGADWRENE